MSIRQIAGFYRISTRFLAFFLYESVGYIVGSGYGDTNSSGCKRVAEYEEVSRKGIGGTKSLPAYR